MVKMVSQVKMVKTVNQVNRLLKHQRSLKNQIPHHILQKPLRSLANQKDVTPAPQNPSNRGLNKPQTQSGNQLAKTPAAHDTHRQLPATGETTNPFFTAAAVAIMTTAGVVAVAKRQENN
ncbi:LPXTG-motif cell wall anchor domain-containing protein [Streptococcus pyogenes]|nr:LPXTG-motif cell wall anchor domain-containing protein [Streptococcus pyogenes]